MTDVDHGGRAQEPNERGLVDEAFADRAADTLPVRPPADERVTAIATLAAALDRLHDEAWSGLGQYDLSDAIAALDRVRTAVDSLDALVVGAADEALVWAEHGNASMSAYLRSHSIGHSAQASRRSRLAEALPRMPLTAKALRAGDLTADHARLLASCLHPRYEGQFAAFEPELVGWAPELTWREFEALIARWKEAADETEPDVRDQKHQAVREFHLSRSLNDRGVAKGTLTPVARTIVRSEIDRLCKDLFQKDWDEAQLRLGRRPTLHELSRTDAQRRHDALVIMAERSAGADAHRPMPVQIIVHTSYAEAEAITAEAAGLTVEPLPYDEMLRELADGTQISRRTLHELAIRAHVHRVVFGPDGEVLDFGRSRQFFSRAQRLAAATLQRACACGCGLDAMHCEADHDTERRDGGNTDLRELVFRCRKSHALKTARRTRQRRVSCPCACTCAHRRE